MRHEATTSQYNCTAMLKKCCFALVALLPTTAVSASQFTTTDACNFTFSDGQLPNFRLPEAGPNSPGDVQLNLGNNIITRGWVEEDENGTLHSCNGESSAYHVGDDTWNTTYIGNDGDELEVDVFYATYQNQLWVRHLQPHMDPSLYEALNDTTIRLNITCAKMDQSSSLQNGCLEFTVNFTEATPYNYTEPYEFVDDCSHGFSSGEQVQSVVVHAASPIGPTSSASLGVGNALILAGKADQGLPWSEGFNEDGSRKDDEFWSDWWATVDSRYVSTEESDDPCTEYDGIVDADGVYCCSDEDSTCDSGDVDSDDGFCGDDNPAPCELLDYTYLGCFEDNRDRERFMEMAARRWDMTTELCEELCAGSRQFGTQWSRECWCGPEDADADHLMFGEATNCDMECSGSDDGEICGGHNAMSTYEFRQQSITENALEENEERGCTGSSAQFWDPKNGEWRSTFETIDGESHDLDMFYMSLVDGVNELWVTEIESWMAPSLYNQLQYNYVKLILTCPEDNVVVDSCVIFEPTFTNWSPDVDGAAAGYRFSDPALPSFDIPEAVPNSPGDVLLTTSNSVVTRTGATTETYCNGDSAEYSGEDGYWYNEFVKSDGETHELKHVFYPTQRDLYAATIQANWEPNLRGLLENRIVRLQVYCTNDERAEYLYIRVSGESATCDDIEDLCTEVDGDGDGALQLAPVFNLGAAALSAAYLLWSSTVH
ncbi:unnamed protein product [Ectocarpus sp. 6 AP-2014]